MRGIVIKDKAGFVQIARPGTPAVRKIDCLTIGRHTPIMAGRIVEMPFEKSGRRTT